jgi:hypothetical protein
MPLEAGEKPMSRRNWQPIIQRASEIAEDHQALNLREIGHRAHTVTD